MKTIRAIGPKTCEVVEIGDLPALAAGYIRIRNTLVGVCRSEHDRWKEAQAGDAFGHEPVGVVAEVGEGVTEWKVGDRIGGLWGGSLPGSSGLCEYADVIATDPKLHHLPDGLADTDAMLEPLACLVSAVSKVHLGLAGTPVAVVGCGYMGCGAISLLKARGAYVVAVDIRPESRENAKKYGADEVYSAEEAREKLEANLHPQDGQFPGFDAVMEWGETSESLDLAIHLTKKCGQLCIGAYHTGGKRLVDVQRLNLFAIDCLSVHPREDNVYTDGCARAIELLTGGTWKFRGVPTKIYPRNQFDLAQAELDTKFGVFMKSAIDMTKEEGEPYIVQG